MAGVLEESCSVEPYLVLGRELLGLVVQFQESLLGLVVVLFIVCLLLKQQEGKGSKDQSNINPINLTLRHIIHR